MEASAVHAPSLHRLSLSSPLLRLRSDEQLIALFRAGSEDAFAVIHDRYRQRLFAYVRQMLSGASRADAEDVLQDVFVRAYGALRADEREVNLKAWLYRVAHNRCIDQFRRPTPAAADVFDVSRTPLHDPMETAQRREDLQRLVEDVARLPEQQRSALLMREINGMAYADIAEALDVTVPAIKSLLVRARVGLAEAIEARDTDCAVIREDLAASYDRGVKASGRARRHMRECAGCREYKTALRSMRRSFAALSPVGAAGPVALVAKLLGAGGAGGGAAAGGTAAVGGGTVVGATACKVAAVVCATAITAGGAVEVKRLASKEGRAKPAAAAAAPPPSAKAPAVTAAAVSAPVAGAVIDRRTDPSAAPAERAKPAPAEPVVETIQPPADTPIGDVVDPIVASAGETGGAVAPVEDVVAPADKPIGTPDQKPVPPGGTADDDPQTQDPSTGTGASGGAEPTPNDGAPPGEH